MSYQVCCVLERALQWNSHWSKTAHGRLDFEKHQQKSSKNKSGFKIELKKEKMQAAATVCVHQNLYASSPPLWLLFLLTDCLTKAPRAKRREKWGRSVEDCLSTGWRCSLANPLRLLEPLVQTHRTGPEPPPHPAATTWTYALFFFNACCCSHDALLLAPFEALPRTPPLTIPPTEIYWKTIDALC